MQEHNLNFDHNKQALRILTIYEQRYIEFSGLNLTQEVLDGIQKHESEFYRNNKRIFSPHLESQLVDICDEIAYLSADIEDGLKAGFFKLSDLKHLEIIDKAIINLSIDNQNFVPAISRAVIRYLLEKIREFSAQHIEKYQIKTLQDVQNNRQKIIFWSDEFFEKFNEVKDFLMLNFYKKPPVAQHTEQGQQILKNIFDFLLKNPEKIPQHFMPEERLPQRICDYIAGMTDRFAIEFYEKIKK